MKKATQQFKWVSVLAITLMFDCLSPDQTLADILAAHIFENRVSRLDESTGLPVAGADVPSGEAGLFFPSGLTIGPDGNMYVSSQLTGEILFYDGATGDPLPSPELGGRDGLFATLGMGATPGLLRFGPDSNLYVADTGVENVRILNGTTGAAIGNAVSDGTLASPGFAIGLGFTPEGELLVSKSSPIFQSSIYVVDDLGNATEIVAPGTAGLQAINSMLVGPSGELLVVDLFGNQIVRFDDTLGTNPQQFALIPPEIEFPLPPGAGFPSNFPSDMAFASSGDLLVGVLGLTNPLSGGDNRGALLRYDLEGNLLQTIAMNLSPVSAIAISVPFLEGDVDGDGDVDFQDFLLLQVGFGITSGAQQSDGDLDGDGDVDFQDFLILQANFGSGGDSTLAAAAVSTTAVPEPSTLSLAIAAILMVTITAWRRSS